MLSRFTSRSTSRAIQHSLATASCRKKVQRQTSNIAVAVVPNSQTTRFYNQRFYSSAPMAAPTDTQAAEMQNTTGITPDSMAQTLREKLDASHVDIQDISGGCGQSFAALIVSPQFQGKAALARHRLVNGALKEEIAAIHAWTPKCLTPEQWEKEKTKMATQ